MTGCPGRPVDRRIGPLFGDLDRSMARAGNENPRLITQVETTAATVHDVNVTEQIRDSLNAKGLGPETQLVDMGYMEAGVW